MSYSIMGSVVCGKVLRQLKEIERHYDIRVLYTRESGNRGQRFASPNGDYDV